MVLEHDRHSSFSLVPRSCELADKESSMGPGTGHPPRMAGRSGSLGHGASTSLTLSLLWRTCTH